MLLATTTSQYTLTDGPISSSADITGIVYGWFKLEDCKNKFIQSINYDDINKINIDTFISPQVDGGGVAGYTVNGKDIEFEMVITAENRLQLEELMSEIRKALFGEEKLLQIPREDGSVMQWLSNLENLSFNRDFSENKIQGNVTGQFVLMEDMYEKQLEGYTYSMSWSQNEDIQNTGEKRTNARYVLVFSSASWLDYVSIDTGGYKVEVNETINTGDVLFIDGEDKEVKLNNSFVNYDGIVDNELQTGSNIVKFDFTPAATFTASVTELHKRKYL